MFVGEMACLGAYWVKKTFIEKKTEAEEMPMSPGTTQAQQLQLKTKINPLWLAIPASCDILSSTLSFIALTMCAASVYQMMRGIIVLIVAGMARLFLKKPQYAHHLLSLGLIFLGVFIVGISSTLLKPDSAPGEDTSPLGIILLIISQFFAGGLYITEEKILGSYYLDPLYVVGWEGTWGLAYYLILLPIF
jgi:drug/metabolite transporter (DMT)-like permease